MLIDMENVTPAHMEEVMRRAKRYGNVTRRLAFGPMTEGKWATARLKHAIRWGSQSQVKTGKNSADIELTITAMELLNDRSVTGYCIVSSDSDFTPLVMKLREAGRLVVGFGEKKAPAAFVKACDRFEVVGGTESGAAPARKAGTKPAGESTRKAKSGSGAPKQKSPPDPNPRPRSSEQSRKEFLDLVKRGAAKAKQHDGWINVSVLGSRIREIKPGIRYQDYGHKTLIGILETFPGEIETKGDKNRRQIRLKG